MDLNITFTEPDRKAQEDILREEGRLPPGQFLAKKFAVLHYGPIPPFSPAVWDFSIFGEVENPQRLSWEEFNLLPRTKIKLDLHCVTKWSLFDTNWEGVSFGALVKTGWIRLLPSARYVLQHSENGYSTNLPLEAVLGENFLLATHYNGIALTPAHGYPLRGVIGAIPGRPDLATPYLWKGAKWLRGLEFMPEDRFGFWEKAGYHNEGDIWKEQRLA